MPKPPLIHEKCFYTYWSKTYFPDDFLVLEQNQNMNLFSREILNSISGFVARQKADPNFVFAFNFPHLVNQNIYRSDFILGTMSQLSVTGWDRIKSPTALYNSLLTPNSHKNFNRFTLLKVNSGLGTSMGACFLMRTLP